ncbi:MAG TPA: hypothetical protein VFQ77_09945 [Pseudonocardiaceae bacterium]|nr:hypothetical protein [Pseudonocardiaceae bacterium]
MPLHRRYLRRRRPWVTSALTRTEVLRALLPAGSAAVRRGNAAARSMDWTVVAPA